MATPEAWARDPALVLDFYNQRRQAVRAAQPNAAHRAIVWFGEEASGLEKAATVGVPEVIERLLSEAETAV